MYIIIILLHHFGLQYVSGNHLDYHFGNIFPNTQITNTGGGFTHGYYLFVGTDAYAQGRTLQASGYGSHAEGIGYDEQWVYGSGGDKGVSIASGSFSHVEGYHNTTARQLLTRRR